MPRWALLRLLSLILDLDKNAFNLFCPRIRVH
jgi:hypothetical protein